MLFKEFSNSANKSTLFWIITEFFVMTLIIKEMSCWGMNQKESNTQEIYSNEFEMTKKKYTCELNRFYNTKECICPGEWRDYTFANITGPYTMYRCIYLKIDPFKVCQQDSDCKLVYNSYSCEATDVNDPRPNLPNPNNIDCIVNNCIRDKAKAVCENNRCLKFQKDDLNLTSTTSDISDTKRVTITADKKEYDEGENVKITIKNNSDKPIWFNTSLGPSKYNFSTLQLEKLYQNFWHTNFWFKVSLGHGNPRFSPSKWINKVAQKLEPAKEFSFIWHIASYYRITTGNYRMQLDHYVFDYDYATKLTVEGNGGLEDWDKVEKDCFRRIIFSNEFVIKGRDAYYKKCQSSEDCVIVSFLCDKLQCLPGDEDWRWGCGSVDVINRENKGLWEMDKKKIKFTNRGEVECELLLSPTSYSPVCNNNLCEAVLRKE